MPQHVHAVSVKRNDPDDMYNKTLRMIKGCKTREQLHTAFNFIDLLSMYVPGYISQDKLEIIRKEHNLKEASLFGGSTRKNI